MKTKTLIIADIVFIFIMFNLLFVNIKNTFIINKYQEGKYLENDAKLLTNITFQKSYVSNYNFGNILYQNGEYEKAISEYKKALKTVISSEKEFKIRLAKGRLKNFEKSISDATDYNGYDLLIYYLGTYKMFKVLNESKNRSFSKIFINCNDEPYDVDDVNTPISRTDVNVYM